MQSILIRHYEPERFTTFRADLCLKALLKRSRKRATPRSRSASTSEALNINPSGISFGPNASLDVAASFYASTGNYLKLGTTGRFDATNTAASVLTTDPPSAFGFLGPSPASITAQGSTLALRSSQTLALIGGTVDLHGAALHAPSGMIHIVGVAGPSEVNLPVETVPTLTAGGSINLTDSTVETNGNLVTPSGTIRIIGGVLTMVGSQVTSVNNSKERAGPV